jgi:hypothetical protein
MDALASISCFMADAISTGSRLDLKVFENSPVTFFSRLFSNLSKNPKTFPCSAVSYHFTNITSIRLVKKATTPNYCPKRAYLIDLGFST